jgi:hypothetical protein
MTSYQFLTSWLQSKVDSERGASLVECIIAITFLGESASSKLSTVGNSISNA